MTRMTFDDLADAYDGGYDSQPEAPGYTNLNHCLGLRAVADAVDRAAVRRVLDRIEGERRYWDPRDAHRDLDDLISEMREELDRGDANG